MYIQITEKTGSEKSCPRRRASNGDEVVCGEKSESILSCNDAFLKTHRVKRIHPRPCVSQHILHAMLDTDQHWSAAHEDPGRTPHCLFTTPITKHLQAGIGKRCPARHSNQQIAEENQQQTHRFFSLSKSMSSFVPRFWEIADVASRPTSY